MELRIINTDNTDPYANLAAEEYLTLNAEEGVLTLFLWRNAHTVVIGKNQNPWRECSVEAVKRDGVRLARRMSGGGAVYHDLGNLNFTFIARDGLFDTARQTEVILQACRLLGVDARKTGRNDLTAGGRKFSGHAYYSSHGYNYHHGTIMMDVKGDDLSKYLKVPESKLRSKGVESVRSRVTNLRDCVAEPLRTADTEELIAAMKDAMIRAAAKEYGCEPLACCLPEVPEELLQKYASEEWRYGTRIPFEKELIRRFDWGEVQILMSMKGGSISGCRIYSDSLETELFDELGRLLAGCRYDAQAVRELELPDAAPAAGYEILEYIAEQI